MSQIDSAARAAMLIPDSTRSNYVTEVRRAAVARGLSVDAARAQQVKNWREQHDVDPMGGWNVLADWLETADLGISDQINPADAAKVRALESAKRDPANPLNGILDLSDAEVRDEVNASLAYTAERGSSMAPVTTDDGEEVPAARVDAVLAEGSSSTEPAEVTTAESPKTTVPSRKQSNSIK